MKLRDARKRLLLDAAVTLLTAPLRRATMGKATVAEAV